jgi:hypothetical protein
MAEYSFILFKRFEDKLIIWNIPAAVLAVLTGEVPCAV